MSISITNSDVSNIDGQVVGAGQSGSFGGTATFTFADPTTSVDITGAVVQSADTDYSVIVSPITITGNPGDTAVVPFTVTYNNDNTPETVVAESGAVDFSTGNYLVSAGVPTADGTVVGSTASFTITAGGGWTSEETYDVPTPRVWPSRSWKRRNWNQGHL